MAKARPPQEAQAVKCAVCGKMFPPSQTRDARVVRPSIAKIIVSDGFDWNENKRVCSRRASQWYTSDQIFTVLGVASASRRQWGAACGSHIKPSSSGSSSS